VQGLKSSPQWNGQEVTLTDGLALERYPCKLASGAALRLKPGNLAPRTTCSQCGAECGSLKNCARCGVSAYCDKACQAQHWRAGHKKVCCSDVATQEHVSTEQLCEVHMGPGGNKYTCSAEVADLYVKQNECVGRKDWRSLAALEEQIRRAVKKPMMRKDEAKLLGVMLQNLSTAFKRLGERLDAAAELDKHPLIEHAQQTFRKENSGEFLQVDRGESEESEPTEQDRMIAQMNGFLINKDWQGIIGMEGRIRELARNAGPQNSEFLGASLLNLSVAFRNTGRTDEAAELANHPLVQFKLDLECRPGEMGEMSAEDGAFVDEFNELMSRRDFAAVVRLESKVLSLVSTLRKLRQDGTAGALVQNLAVCLDQTGNNRRAQELGEQFFTLIQKCQHDRQGVREEEHKQVERFLELCAAKEWLEASKLKQQMLEAVVCLNTEHPKVAEQVYIFNNLTNPVCVCVCVCVIIG